MTSPYDMKPERSSSNSRELVRDRAEAHILARASKLRRVQITLAALVVSSEDCLQATVHRGVGDLERVQKVFVHADIAAAVGINGAEQLLQLLFAHTTVFRIDPSKFIEGQALVAVDISVEEGNCRVARKVGDF